MNRYRPELHVTAEVGVLEAPAGALSRGESLHVFHQFRPRPDAGARWAHQVASGIPYGWDVCDDVLVPRDDEIDCLAGSSVPVGDGVELFFVTTSAAADASDGSDAAPSSLQSNVVAHGRRGARNFTLQRARIADLASATTEVSDDPSVVSPFVERLGAVDIDDSAFPIHNLATPSVVRRGEGWTMLALDLVDDEDARIVVLDSPDRQSWTVRGELAFVGESVPEGRPYAPRITLMTDLGTEQDRVVLFITYPDDSLADSQAGSKSGETTGYIVGDLDGTTFRTATDFQVLDHGHDFTRPRLVHGTRPVISGLVGAFPHSEDGDEPATWANCLSVPRFLSLRDGHLYQDVIGLPTAVRSYTDRAAVYTAQLSVETGSATVDVLDTDGNVLLGITHSGEEVSVTRDGDTRSAPLADGDSDTLTIFVDGPVCEVFADGGLVSLTTALTAPGSFDRFAVRATGGARVLSAMESLGRQLQRQLAHLDDPEEQEKLIREAVLADRDLAAGIDPGE